MRSRFFGLMIAVALALCVQAARAGTLTLTFTYGSEKEEWIKEVTADFNARQFRTSSGNVINVQAIPMGSGECIDEIVQGKRQTHITSPASRIFIDIANANSSSDTPLVKSPRSLVVSPVVIAMWKPMAEALGYGQRPIGWAEIIELMRDPKGWARYDFPKWGKFKFGHTHPEYSNSGLLSLIATVYVGAEKTADLMIEDVDRPQTGQFLSEIERAVIHYGSSTGFFGKKMFASGPEYLSAAVLYENMVIESYDPKYKLDKPVVAIYPKEGTFWSDHPAGIVQKPWVTAEHRAAADVYINFLLERPQQEKAMKYGFRPADATIALGAPFDAAHGVDPQEPRKILPLPTRDVTERILDLWRKQKKRANVTLVLDVSGSMSEEQKMERLKPAASQLIQMLGDEDRLSLMVFSTDIQWKFHDLLMKEARKQAVDTIQSLRPFGRTCLYDAIADAYEQAVKQNKPDQMSVVVVMTDGEDTNSKLGLDRLKTKIAFVPETQPILVFTIGYGSDADAKVLGDIAKAAQSKFYAGTPENIQKVMEDTATFFGAGGRSK